MIPSRIAVPALAAGLTLAGVGLAAPSAPAVATVVAVSAPAPAPDVLSWTGWHRCYFQAPNHWEDYRVHIDRIGSTAKEWQVQIRGTEPVTTALIYESRDGVDYTSGGYAGPASANWTSPVTRLPYLSPGKASRWAHIRLKRDSTITLFQYCHSHTDM